MEWNVNNQSDRQKYYVNVQARQIYETADIAPYHLEIMATSEEVDELRVLFNSVVDNDERTLSTIFMQVGENSPDTSEVNSMHNDKLRDVFKAIYKLGTDETKAHIASMNFI